MAITDGGLDSGQRAYFDVLGWFEHFIQIQISEEEEPIQ